MSESLSDTTSDSSVASASPLHAALAVVAALMVAALVVRGASPLGIVLGVCLATVIVGGGVIHARGSLRRSGRLARWLTVIGLALLLAIMWQRGLYDATRPSEAGVTFVQSLQRPPMWAIASSDEALYFRYVRGVAAGQGYYDAAVRTLAEANARRGGAIIDAGTPLSYRPPLMYHILGALPQNGYSFVIVTLLVGTIACASGYWLAARYVPVHLALVSATLIGLRAAWNAAGIRLFHTEVWAGALGLLALALLVWASERRSPRVGLMGVAAGTAFLAAATRELGVGFILVGLLATLSTAEGRRLRLWAPWTVALGAAAATYLMYWRAARAAIDRVGIAAMDIGTPWLNADPAGILATLRQVNLSLDLINVVSAALVALGVLGALIAPRTALARIALGTAVTGGVLATTFLYPHGLAPGSSLPPGYWAELILPMTLACVPIAASRLPSPPRADYRAGASSDLSSGATARTCSS